ncbi:MAG TPA: surface-adhesin E family protein [Ramlibacter sp.]
MNFLAKLALAGLAAAACCAHAQEWTPLGEVHDRMYALDRNSLTPIEGGFAFGVFSDKHEGAPPDTLPNGKAFRSSFLGVEVNCERNSFRVARARFFSESRAAGEVVAEDQLAPGDGWAPAQPGTLGGLFVAAACPRK